MTNTAALDDITTFLGAMTPEEYEQRRRIRTCRNCANFKATQTENRDALTLCWMITETATAWIYAPADVEALAEVAKFLRRLLIVADHAEIVEAL